MGATLRMVRESLRLNPPAGTIRRSCKKPVDLGEHGCVPAGCAMSIFLRDELIAMGKDFNPDRWSPEEVREHGHVTFGGSQPHSCIGKGLALIELQLFARVLCREYDFKAIDPEFVVDMPPIKLGFKDGLRVQVFRKATV